MDARGKQLTRPERASLNRFLRDLRRDMGGQVIAVTLFGSRARGEGNRCSDLDVLVVLEDDGQAATSAVRYLAADTLLDCGKFVSTRVWSRARLEAEQARPGGLYQNILRDGVPLWGGEDRDALVEVALLEPSAGRLPDSV
jgi:predicted nucleotidyltransferase